MCGQLPPECVRLDVIGERANPVDLDDREPLTVAGLELGVAADVDLLELEAELFLQRGDLCPRALAEVTPLCMEDADERRYG